MSAMPDGLWQYCLYGIWHSTEAADWQVHAHSRNQFHFQSAVDSFHSSRGLERCPDEKTAQDAGVISRSTPPAKSPCWIGSAALCKHRGHLLLTGFSFRCLGRSGGSFETRLATGTGTGTGLAIRNRKATVPGGWPSPRRGRMLLSLPAVSHLEVAVTD